MKDNANLSNIGALLGWPADAVTNYIYVQNNPALPQCQVDALESLLDAPCTDCTGNLSPSTCNAG